MIAAELLKQTHRARAWVTLAVMAAVPVLLTAVIGTTRPGLPERIGDLGAVVPNTSGLTMPLVALNATVVFLLPLGVAVFAGEAFAGEAAWGSLRYLLARPISRSGVFASKAAVAAGFSVAAVVVVSTSSLLAGAATFGWRPLTVLDLEHSTAFSIATATYSPGAALWLLSLATAAVAGTMASTFAFGLLLSALTRTPFSATAGAVGFGLVSRALDNVPGLSALNPWLPMTDAGTTAWTALFTQHPNLGPLEQQAVVQAIYTTVFVAAAWLRFTRADVLT